MNGPSVWAGAQRKRERAPDLQQAPLGPPGLTGRPSSPGLGKNVRSDLLPLYTHNLHSLLTSLSTTPIPIPSLNVDYANRVQPGEEGGWE